jgi:hypothetical protein
MHSEQLSLEEIMASVLAPNLTLTTVGSNVTINVTYTAQASQLERFLVANGMAIQERITVIGIDPPGGITGTTITFMPTQTLPVTGGAGPLNLARNRTITVTRAVLQEDAGVGDADEVRCKIELRPIGLPASVEGFTDQEVLLG